MNNKNKVQEEIQHRIAAGNRAYFANIKLLKSKCISRFTKLKMYKTLIKPVVTYGAETWTMTVKDENILRSFERKIMRRIMGPVREGNGWRARTNAEVEQFLNDEDIVRHIKAQRIRWLGHVYRMGEDRLPGRLVGAEMAGKRRRGRPRRTCLRDVEEDLLTMGCGRWRRSVERRDEWRQIVREARVHTGL